MGSSRYRPLLLSVRGARYPAAFVGNTELLVLSLRCPLDWFRNHLDDSTIAGGGIERLPSAGNRHHVVASSAELLARGCPVSCSYPLCSRCVGFDRGDFSKTGSSKARSARGLPQSGFGGIPCGSSIHKQSGDPHLLDELVNERVGPMGERRKR